MFDLNRPRTSTSSASTFVTPTGYRRSGFDIWAEAGRATELAYRQPAPISHAVRITIVVALVAAAKLCSAGML